MPSFASKKILLCLTTCLRKSYHVFLNSWRKKLREFRHKGTVGSTAQSQKSDWLSLNAVSSQYSFHLNENSTDNPRRSNFDKLHRIYLKTTDSKCDLVKYFTHHLVRIIFIKKPAHKSALQGIIKVKSNEEQCTHCSKWKRSLRVAI